jgi:hypothetical protein
MNEVFRPHHTTRHSFDVSCKVSVAAAFETARFRLSDFPIGLNCLDLMPLT